VPSTVVGESLAQARKDLRRTGLRPGKVFRQSSSQFAPGQVISTVPQPGQAVAVGSKVNLYVSSGVVLPDVTGESEGQAKSDLHNAGFDNIKTSTQTSTSAASGTVISENPNGGTHALPSSTTVSLVIAQAPPPVPNVTGQTASAASSQLQSAGFTVAQRTRTVSNQSRDGIVLRQIPQAGTRLKKGSTVTIVVGRFSQTTTTTTTTGQTGATGTTGATGH
jgi:serine/threonine-protein kinase